MGAVHPAWLHSRLADPALRVLDVREDRGARDTGARSGAHLDLRALAHLGGTDGYHPLKDRYPRLAGPPRIFLEGHVPSAIAMDVRAQLFDDVGGPIGAPELAMVMSGLGVGDEHDVVLVDDGPMGAALAAAWMLHRHGHARVHVLFGGHARWLAEGRPLSVEVVKHAPASFTARVLP